MSTEYLTADRKPAKFWAYVGDGDWVAAAEKVPGVYTKARRLEVFLPIDQLPRDGLISYTTAKGKPITERVLRGETI
jgi:hypothetical protein